MLLLHRVVAEIGDEDIAAAIDRDADGIEEPAAERLDRLGLGGRRSDAPPDQQQRADETG